MHPVRAFPREERGPSNPPAIISQPILPGWGFYTANMNFTNELPATVFEPEAHAIPEGIIKRGILRRTTGHGVHQDHPVIARAVIESLQGHQPILDLYLGGQALA